MFPGLAAKLKDAARVEIVYQGKTTAIESKNGRWGLADRAGYPIEDKRLHEMLTAVTEMRLVEPRTSDPAQLARLGVDDPMKANSTARLLRIVGTDGKPFLEVVLGHRRVRSQGKVDEQIYARRPNETQSWLADGAPHADSDVGLWFDRDLTNIDNARIASVAVDRNGEKLLFKREGEKLTLAEPAEHPKLEEYRLEDVARAFQGLTLQEVRPASQPIGDKVGSATFATTDGLTLTVTLFRADKDVWAVFGAVGADKVADEAAALQKKFDGWIFEVGSWKEKSMTPLLSDLVAEKPAEAPAAK